MCHLSVFDVPGPFLRLQALEFWFFYYMSISQYLDVGAHFLILVRHGAHLDPPETPPSSPTEQTKINKGREPKTDM